MFYFYLHVVLLSLGGISQWISYEQKRVIKYKAFSQLVYLFMPDLPDAHGINIT